MSNSQVLTARNAEINGLNVISCCSIRHDIIQAQSSVPFAPSCYGPRLRPLTPSQSDSLAIFLKLSDKLITLLHYIVVLLILVVWSISLDDALACHSIDGTWDSLCCNEFCQVTGVCLVHCVRMKKNTSTYRSKKSSDTPKSLAILSKPTTR